MYSGTISGKKLGVTIGNANTVLIGVFELQFDPQVDELDATTGADNGFGDVDTGVMQAEVTMTMYVDVTNSQFLTIVAGTLLTNVKVYLSLGAITPLATIPFLKVLSTPIRARVRDSWQIQFRAKSRGEFTVNL
jgi:hypothetical protein